MKEITTNNQTILLVEVPEDAREFKIENGLLLFKADFIPFGIVILPSGQYQILGKSTELSEEQMKDIVEPAKHSSSECFIDPKDDTYTKSIDCYNRPRWTKITSTFYKDYAAKQKPRSMTWLGEVDTVQESYLSLLESNGIVDRNMIDKPNEADILEEHEDWIYARAKYKSLLEQWQESQSKVKHYLVLKRI